MKKRFAATFITVACVAFVLSGTAFAADRNIPKRVFWGDTHLHTANSMDAYWLENTAATPDVAYRYAKGFPVVNASNGVRIQIETPLDFLVVADHGEYMAIPFRLFTDKDEKLRQTEFGRHLVKLWDSGKKLQAAYELVGTINDQKPYGPFVTETNRRTAWERQIQAADAANEPGKFTAFIGWEWSSFPNAQNLHRVLFTPDDANVAGKLLPFSALDSSDPEDLWAWMEQATNATGARLVAIAHNSNISNGLMFSREGLNGEPIDAQYAATRARWEPVYEVTQIKGDSETHPLQSPNDEFADFATYDHLLDAAAAARGEEVRQVVKEGDYARRGLRTGLDLEREFGVNPFKFGMIGSTDSHSSMASAEENNFWGKFAIDSTPAKRRDLAILPGTTNSFGMSAAGLAAVWAEENTRESIFEAFKRKEVYATTGPRITLRFFGGYEFRDADVEARNMAQVGYDKGVPMGGDLASAPSGKAPSFVIHAMKDPKEGNLDRVQVIKGWLDKNGKSHEKIYDVAVSDDRKIGKDDRCRTPVGNTVNLETGAYTNDIGAAQLATVWVDPDFDPAQRAFYYVRVLQIPTPRYSLLDAIALQMDYRETGQPATIQERAYSSPIWYTPADAAVGGVSARPVSAVLKTDSLLADGYAQMSGADIQRQLIGKALILRDLNTGLEYKATLAQGRRTLTLSEDQMNRAAVSAFHGGPLLLGDAIYSIEGNRVVSTDGVSTIATTLYRKEGKIYAARDVDQDRVNFEVLLED